MCDLWLEGKDNSVLFSKCGKWIHCRCVMVMIVIHMLSVDFACSKCKKNIREALEQ